MLSTLILLQQTTETTSAWLTDNWLVTTMMKGGLEIMLPLFIFSVITLGILIERVYKYYSIPKDDAANAFLGEIDEIIKKYGNIEKVVEHLKQVKSILSYVMLKIVMRYKFLVVEKRPILDMRNELLDTADDAQREYLEEFLPIINTISSVATLLGLLGTIMGMISSFDEIAKGGKGDPAVVAGGISVALLTTAGGLIVAIPAVLSYSFLKRRMEKIVLRLDPLFNHFINFILRDLARMSTYREMLLTAYRDGILNSEEQKFLKEKRIELNISEDEFKKISEEIQKELGFTVNLEKVGE